MALTALQIKHAKEGLHADGNGLYLQVTESNTKSWMFRYQINGRRRAMGLGSLAEKSAIQAREMVASLRAKVAAGIDPLEEKRAAEAAKLTREVEAKLKSTTFKAAAIEYISNKSPEWSNAKHTAQWVSTLTKWAFPVFGDMPVGDVATEHVLEVLKPIWLTKTETATRVRQRIENILDYARFKNWRTGENPARWSGHLEHSLPKANSVRVVRHHPALPFAQMPEFMDELRAREGNGARALEFVILTAARSGEVRGARWDEIDMENRVWIVPAARMKAKREHRVPLSDSAWHLLDSLPRVVGEPLVFPGWKANTPLSDMSLKATIDRINETREAKGLPLWLDPKTGTPVVPHGFRSSFRDWAAEVTDYPNEMGELALAHTVGDKVEAAYRRGNMFEKRRKMMNDWATWCEASGANTVVSILANVA